MSSAENALPTNNTRALARLFFTRAFFACLLGMGVPLYNFVADLLFTSKSLSLVVDGAAGAVALVVTVNTVGTGVVTYTTRQHKNARPSLWALPVSFAVLAGLMLAVFSIIGITDLYPNAITAFIAGAISGAAAGLGYALNIPGLRQDTILQQIRRSLIIGGVIGVLIGLYFFIKVMPPNASDMILVYHAINALVSVPITIVGMLLSFVLGIEMGDRYIER